MNNYLLVLHQRDLPRWRDHLLLHLYLVANDDEELWVDHLLKDSHPACSCSPVSGCAERCPQASAAFPYRHLQGASSGHQRSFLRLQKRERHLLSLLYHH